MKHPTIADAKALAKRDGCQAVIVLFFKDLNFGGSSYGQSKAKCDAAGKVLDLICDEIGTGQIELPDILRF